MATSSLAAQTGGFAWSTAWFPEGETWDDTYAWADVAAWEANPRTPLVLGEASSAGSFSVAGQSITEDLLENVSVGAFSLEGQTSSSEVSELAIGQFFTLGGKNVNKGLLEAIDFGTFSVDGQAANKSLSDNITFGNFVFNGRPITEAISESFNVGTFVLTGNAVNEKLLENTEVANFNLEGQVAGRVLSRLFGTGEFFTNFGGIYYNEVWQDTALWVDTDLWNDGDNVDIDIVERGGIGTFSLAGQDHIKRIRRIAEGTTYSITGQAAFRVITTPAPVQAYQITNVSFLQNISEHIGFGNFSLTEFDAMLSKPRYEFDNGLTRAVVLLDEKPNSATVLEFLDGKNNSATLVQSKNRYS